MSVFCHNVRPVRQPTKRVNEGGDCFACAVLAIMQHLFPERTDLTLEFIHRVFTSEYQTGGEHFINSWNGYDTVFHRLSSGYFHNDIAFPKFDIEYRRYFPLFDQESLRIHNFAWNQFGGYSNWSWMVDTFLRAGYLLLIEIDSEGEGPIIHRNKKIYKNSTDHVCVIDGFRRRAVPVEAVKGARSIDNEVHVVDSNTKHKTNTRLRM